MNTESMKDDATSGDAPDLQQLKELALAAKHWLPPEPWEQDRRYSDYEVAGLKFNAAANPEVVLDLIARIERAAAPAPSDWTIHDPHGVIAQLRTASQVMLDAACKNIGWKENNELSKAADALDNALADAVGIEESIVAHPATASGDELPKIPEPGYSNSLADRVFHLSCKWKGDPALHSAILMGHTMACEQAYNLVMADEQARAAVSAATKPTADLFQSVAMLAGCLKQGIIDDQAFIDRLESLLATKPAAAPAVPEGFVLAPIKSTSKMDRAGMKALRNLLGDTAMQVDAEGCWSAMIEACAATPAASTTGAPEGYVLMPKRLDVKMVQAWIGPYHAAHGDIEPLLVEFNESWERMIAAAPASTTGAAQTAEQVREPEPREVWSNNNEDFNFDTLGDLLDDGDYKPGDTVWVGEAVKPDLSELIDADDVADQMAERAGDIAGEHADGYPDLSKDDKRELDALLSGWIARCCPPNFYRVENVKPYVLSADDFPTPTHSSEAGE